LLQAGRENEAARYHAAPVFSRYPIDESKQGDGASQPPRAQRTRRKRLPLFRETVGMMNLNAANMARPAQFDKNIVCVRMAPMSSIAKAESGWFSAAGTLQFRIDGKHGQITFEA
jgi:hypothetical protein